MANTEARDRQANVAIPIPQLPSAVARRGGHRRHNHCEADGRGRAPGDGWSPDVRVPHAEHAVVSPYAVLDPLAEDDLEDMPLVTTARGLLRLATVAAQTGQRFRDEGIDHDPVVWLTSPRALFGGRTAIEACQSRPSFMHATMLHGLSLGLDCDPDEMQSLLGRELMTEDEAHAPHAASEPRAVPRRADGGDKAAGRGDDGGRPGPTGRDWRVPADGRLLLEATVSAAGTGTRLRVLEEGCARTTCVDGGAPSTGRPSFGGNQLFTATMTRDVDDQVCHLFHAALAENRDGFIKALEDRLGADGTRRMAVGQGIDWHCPAVEAIVASEMSHLLDDLEHGEGMQTARHLDLWVERRLAPLPAEA